MACESCKVVVRSALEKLNLPAVKVELGEIVTKEDITDDQKKKLNDLIKKAGLELLERRQGILIEKIKKNMIEYVYSPAPKPAGKFSAWLSKKLGHTYAYLANFFSEVEATTIEQYLIALKIERIKELIILEECSLSQIADKLHYSSIAHMSNQFKKVTGLSPSHFKKLKKKRRITIQDLAKH
ncbi:MAG: transcriptional regulator, AraC family [Bacteroidetes bacterium]|nr:transcriptional regulator, AraC family [Bacteroidota bacterium]